MIAVLVHVMSAHILIQALEAEYLKSDLPDVQIGDTVKVGVRIQEGTKERVQPYEGVVIAMHRGSVNTTVTVRRVFQGVGVERVFLIHSPLIASIQILQRAKVRRAKLYYLRQRTGKAARLKRRFT